MNTKNEKLFDYYVLEAWIDRLQSVPVKIIESIDLGGAYEVNSFHVVKLENKKYATIYESGCSCYSSEDAEIDLHPTKRSAMAALDAWKKEQRGS